MEQHLRVIRRTLGEAIRRSRELVRNTGGLRVFRIQNDRGKERYRRAALTGAASIIQRGLTILISLVSVPLTIHYLGPERYGVWLTISSILVWLALTNFGLAGDALINVVSDAHGRDDKRDAQQYVASAIWSLALIAAFLGAITFFCFRYISWAWVFRTHAIPAHELALASGLTLTFFLISLPLSVQHSVYCAYQDGAFSNAWGIVMNVSTLIALVIVTQLSGGLPELVVAISGTRMLVGIGNTIYIFRRYPWLVPVPTAVRWHCIRRLVNLGGKYFLSQLGTFGIENSQPLLITQILGPAAVVPFVVSQRLITLPMEAVYLSSAPLVPAFGEARARDDWNWIHKAFRRTTLASILLGIPMVLVLGCIARPVIRLWAGPAAVPSWTLISGLMVFNIVGVIFMATWQLLTGLQRVAPLVVSTVLCAVCTIGFGILGCFYMGVAGVAVAMAVSKLATFWPIQWLAARKLLRSEHSVTGLVVNEEVA